MTQFDGHIDRLIIKVQKLIEYNQELQKQILDLQTANQNLHKQIEEEQEKVKALDEQLAYSDVKETESRDKIKNAKQLQKQLDKHIQDIDKCIEWLQSN